MFEYLFQNFIRTESITVAHLLHYLDLLELFPAPLALMDNENCKCCKDWRLLELLFAALTTLDDAPSPR